MPKVKVSVQFAATKIICSPQKDQDDSFLPFYSSKTVSVNISDKPKKWWSIFF